MPRGSRQLHGARSMMFVLSTLMLVGCGRDDRRGGSGSSLAEDGEQCFMPTECASGLCPTYHRGPSFCTTECTTDADCAWGTEPMVCGIDPDGRGVCTAPCDPMDWWPPDRWYCIDRRPVACEHSLCGCDCAPGTYCEPPVGCVPGRPVGGECVWDEHCESLNCNLPYLAEPPGACAVPLGSACDSTNCEVCWEDPSGSGETFCSKQCVGPGACNNDTVCAGYTGTEDSYYCRRQCTSDADCTFLGTCRPVIDDITGRILYRACVR